MYVRRTLTFYLLALTALSGTAVRAGNMVLVLYALKLGSSAFVIGLLGAMLAVLPMIFSMPAGRLADRYGSRALLLFCLLGSSLGLLVPWAFPGVTAMFVASALIGLSLAMVVPLQNLMGLISTPESRARNFANFSLGMGMANLMGPLIGGFFVDLAGPATTCLYLALLNVVAIAMLVVRGGRLPRAPTGPKATGSVYAILRIPDVRRTIATSSLINVGRDLYSFYFPVYAHGIGLSASLIGIVQAVNFGAELTVRLFLARLLRTFREERVLSCSFFVGAVSLGLMPFFHSVYVLAALSFMLGLGMGCGQPIITMLMYSYSPKGRTAEALGLRMTFIHLTKLVGPVVFGAIGSALGLAAMFALNAAVMAGGGVLSTPKAKQPASETLP
ncbi:MAG TPA: MFS transporter [Burkholderiales bacterium]|nr:MFS transporter [Burkholderiales bacterium]